MWIGQLVPNKPVRQAYPTKRNESDPTTAGKREIKSIITYVPQWTT